MKGLVFVVVVCLFTSPGPDTISNGPGPAGQDSEPDNTWLERNLVRSEGYEGNEETKHPCHGPSTWNLKDILIEMAQVKQANIAAV